MFVDLLMKFRFIYLCLIVVFIVITIIIAILVFFFQYIFESNDDYARKKSYVHLIEACLFQSQEFYLPHKNFHFRDDYIR